MAQSRVLVALGMVGIAVPVSVAGAPAPGRLPPARIVSINPCIDAILLEVADDRQIAAISHYSQDPQATSIPLDRARRFKATSGTAEEVMALAPRLVISGGHVAPATAAALQRLRIPLLQLPVPTTVAESLTQIREIAAVTGHVDRGEALVARIGAALAAARPPHSRPIPALIWQSGGLVPGSGTLASELLERAGFHNLSADYGLKQWDVLPLEYLIARAPRLVLSASGTSGRRDAQLAHPALVRLGRQIAIRPFSFRLLQCGGPTIIAAMARLSAVRRSLAAS